MHSRIVAGIAGGGLVVFALALPASTAFACSLDPLGPYEVAGSTLFIGAATSDSLSVRLSRDVQWFGLKTITLQPPAFAQLVQVERLSSRVPSDVRKAIDANYGRVLIVPWTYEADCAPARWTGGALWTPPGQRGVFGARLRDRERWENGVPTFDVGAPLHVPYPAAMGLRPTTRKSSLSPDELLAMYDAIPPRVQSVDPARNAAILKWAELHPDLASRQPLANMVSAARHSAMVGPFNARESPLAGTYRFVIEMQGGDSVVFFGRTGRRPDGLIWSEGIAHDSYDRPIGNPYGYYLHLGVAKEVSELPTVFPAPATQGYLAASFDPVISGPDSTVWSAGAELIGAAAGIVDDNNLKARLNAIGEETFAGLGRAPNYTPGEFNRRVNGSVTLHVILRGGSGVIATVRGERLSTGTLSY